MKTFTHNLLIISLLLGVCTYCSSAQPESVDTLEGLVGEWVALRRQIESEQQAWKQKSRQLMLELDLLEKEEKQLDAQIEQARSFEADKESRTAEQLAKKTEFANSLAKIDPIVERTIAAIKEISRRIPVSLQSAQLEKMISSFEADKGRSSDPARRLQLTLSALHEIGQLQNSIHVTRELLTIEGEPQRREMDVIYLGLARAYAVSPDDRVAAIGSLSGTSWKWVVNSDIGASVRQMVSEHLEEAPPTLVTLPMTGETTGEKP